MKPMSYAYMLFVMIALSVLCGCSSGSDDDSGSDGDDNNGALTARTRLFVGDASGNLSVFDDSGEAPMPRVATFSLGELDLGEIVIANGKAFVTVSTGFTGEVQGLESGGLVVVDIENLEVEDQIILESTQTGRASRLVHSYIDPENHYLWMNNDGPSGDNADDSVFRIDARPDSPDYLSVVEIMTGDGHHKSAFSYPSADQPDARRLFVTHNLSARSLSVIDNDPDSPTFLEVIKTVGPGDETTPGTDFVPHGMDYSPVSGHIYAGMTSPVNWAVTIIDTTAADLPVTAIPAGAGAGEIPAAGYVHAAHGGQTVYTTGYRAAEDGSTGAGWLSAIDATNNDAVIAVIDLGNVASSSFDENGVKLYVPSRRTSSGGPKTDVVVVVDIDPASATYHQVLGEITVGEAGDHRNGGISTDGRRAYYPDNCETCATVSAIDTETDTVVDTPVVEGLIPGDLGTARLQD